MLMRSPFHIEGGDIWTRQEVFSLNTYELITHNNSMLLSTISTIYIVFSLNTYELITHNNNMLLSTISTIYIVFSLNTYELITHNNSMLLSTISTIYIVFSLNTYELITHNSSILLIICHIQGFLVCIYDICSFSSIYFIFFHFIIINNFIVQWDCDQVSGLWRAWTRPRSQKQECGLFHVLLTLLFFTLLYFLFYFLVIKQMLLSKAAYK